MIIPAYNEAENILGTVESLRQMKPITGYEIDYIVINDSSIDHTQEVLHNNKLNHINLITNLGIGGCVQTGYKYARMNDYDIAIQFDGDGQHDSSYINTLLQAMEDKKLDLCIGSRFAGMDSEFKSTIIRRIGIRYLAWLLKFLSGGSIRISDPTSGFRAANKEVLNYFADHYPVDYPEPESIMSAARQEFSMGEVPVNMFARAKGESSIRPLNSIYYMVKVSIAIVFDRIVKKW